MFPEQADVRPVGQLSNKSWQWFNYNDVPSSVSKFLKGQADRIRRSAGRCVIEIGKDLIGAKHYLSHGAFLRWVASEVGMPTRTAQAYMQVAHWASGKPQNVVALLPSTILYLLSGSTVPKEFTDDILKRTEAGEVLTLPVIREELKTLRCDRRKKGRNGRGATGRNATSARATKIAVLPIERDDYLMEAVGIVARGLSASDFDRVRDVLTSESVLNDPNLGRRIKNAFFNASGMAHPAGMHAPAADIDGPITASIPDP